ncbi:MAG: tail fiber domain-containing protein [Bacteroidota bacterium]
MYINRKFPTICLLYLMAGWATLLAQPNPGIRYQAVYRDSSNTVVKNQELSVDVRIRRATANGQVVYRETHTASTDLFGLFSLTIGTGNQVSSNSFSDVIWMEEAHFLDVRIDGQRLGTDKLEGVPYSLVATEMELADLQDVSNSPPNNNQVLTWNGNTWEPRTIDSGTELSAGDGVEISNARIINTKPDQEIILNEGEGIEIEGSYPTFTLSVDEEGGSQSIWSSINRDVYYNLGNVGIGTDKPAFSLDVAGDVKILGSEINANALRSALTIQSGQGNSLETMRLDGSEIDATDTKLILNGNSDTDVSLVSGGGRVSIGNFAGRNALGSLHIRHLGTTQGDPYDGIVLQNERGGFRWTFHANHDPSEPTSHRNLGLVFNNNLVAKIDPAGNFATLSDSRVKLGVLPIGSVLSRLARLSPKSYRLLATGDQVHLGFLAQEVQTLFPELVDYHQEGDRYMIRYSGFHALAIQAIKEQQAHIATLEDKINRLESLLSSINERINQMEN